MQESDPENLHGQLGDARPDAADPHVQNESGQKPEKLEGRPMVGSVKPEDYPEGQRAKGA
ncbi:MULTISPECIES: hypothetical protein [unclassified Novosphingobium]|uniref:hypothetical protein n=1 Tax=unclassified Novosphingobium TaxID=2644732 RepID=UPI00135ADDDD|nr:MULTISPECIES: hypothetical protein [unclassified Novosphingobium]